MPQYNDDILNYYKDDSHIGSLDVNDKNVGTGLVGSPSCGDVMKLQIKIEKNKKGEEIIKDAKILVFGCGSAKASSSYVAEKLTGMPLEEAKKIKNVDIANALKLPKLKLHCSVLVEDAIKRAVEDYNNKQKGIKSDVYNQTNKIENNNSNDNFTISITNDAVEFTKKQLEKVEKEKNIKIAGIQLSLEEGHCGLMYKVKYLEDKELKKNSNFITFEKNGLNIFVSKDMKDILNGTEISYKEENLKRGLIFKNPKETGRCSCGKNFFTEENKKNKNK